MSKHRFPFRFAVPLTIAVASASVPAAAQDHGMTMPTTGYRAELIRDLDQLENKYTGLAQAMSGKYAWRPAEGVRSVSEVFMHAAAGNYLLLNMAGIKPPADMKVGNMQEAMATMRQMESVTDEAKVQEAVRQSFAFAKHGIATMSDADLDTKIQLFGQEATKRAALHLAVTHLHEHLGQSIAYARTNGVTPPWSQAGSN